ncbi:hypothetical protein [Leptothoe sp. PORK10 BA2]|uniref:hypothetical protein n=1 Tax=Leptothoe sp. PORK10 BA2 TaxID=3110254 RepID=UPI002B214571|nr:hypothetical protein [Leptothoe sp. PORK10 BA2]MEA5462954.1 hypothetical protein [Leptothoe sp. PORK10 BA2]
MTKKRIADLLKEEVEKTDNAAQTAAKSASKSSKVDADATSAASKGAAAGNQGRARTSKDASAAAVKKTTTTGGSTTALEKQVAELETALKQAKEQILELQGDIETHQTRIFELKDELTAANKATTDKAEELSKIIQELETAKNTIRQITVTPSAETASTKEETPPRVIHGADLASNRSTLSLRNRPNSYKAIPDYAIQRGEQNSMLSDDDIGWVD